MDYEKIPSNRSIEATPKRKLPAPWQRICWSFSLLPSRVETTESQLWVCVAATGCYFNGFFSVCEVSGSFNFFTGKVIGRKRHFRVSHRCLRSAAESLPKINGSHGNSWVPRRAAGPALIPGCESYSKEYHISVSDAFGFFFFRLAM